MTDLPPQPPEPASDPATLLPFTVQHGRAWKATRRAPWIAPAAEPLHEPARDEHRHPEREPGHDQPDREDEHRGDEWPGRSPSVRLR